MKFLERVRLGEINNRFDFGSNFATYVSVALSVRLCVCTYASITLMHPAKAVGRNEMPYVVPSDIVLNMSPIGGSLTGR